MTTLSNGMELEILINEINLPLDQFASPEIQIDGSDEFGIPILSGLLVDNVGGDIIRQFTPIADGSLITISLTNAQTNITREFRASGCQTEGAMMVLRGYLNHPAYVITYTKQTYSGTSQEVLENIANQCGFKFTGVPTADRMAWAGANQRLINFARYVVAASYVSDTSMMTGRITLDGEMRIRNLDIAQPSKGLFGYGEGTNPIYGFQPCPSSLQNFHGGYKQQQTTSNIDGTSENINGIDIQPTEGSFNRNPKLAEMANVGTLSKLPIHHPSNVHANYSRALYNNKRINTLFTMIGNMCINNAFTNLDALDTITLSNYNPVDGTSTGDLATRYDGDWIISSKSTYVTTGQYYERFHLMRMGLSLDMHALTV